MPTKLRAFDLFCGAGGSSWGAQAAGVEVVGGLDAWDLACESFRLNFPRAQVFNERIEDASATAIARVVGKVDLLLASPECTNHSCARGARPRSESSRETALKVRKFVRALSPRWIVLENVVLMRPWGRYHDLIKGLRGLGYHVREQVLDASLFGVPQKRRRLFIICDREREPRQVTPPVLARTPNAREILDPKGTWRVRPLFSSGRAAATIERAERGFRALGWGSEFLLVYYGTDGGGGWQRIDQPLRTLTTLDRFGLVEPSPSGPTLRMLQVPELLRAMAFDGRFKLPDVTRREKIKLLGNSVCPPVMEAIVKRQTGRMVPAHSLAAS
jgi:DNA (cytosine-5)-methyltransferase 1